MKGSGSRLVETEGEEDGERHSRLPLRQTMNENEIVARDDEDEE